MKIITDINEMRDTAFVMLVMRIDAAIAYDAPDENKFFFEFDDAVNGALFVAGSDAEWITPEGDTPHCETCRHLTETFYMPVCKNKLSPEYLEIRQQAQTCKFHEERENGR